MGHHYEHVGLMVSLQRKRLLEKGEYFVVGIDIEQYDASAPDKYLRGLLQDQTDDESITAFKSYLGIVPSPPSDDFDEFARQVNERKFTKFSGLHHLCSFQVNNYMELPPFNYTNPLRLFGGAKQVKCINRFQFFISLSGDPVILSLSLSLDS